MQTSVKTTRGNTQHMLSVFVALLMALFTARDIGGFAINPYLPTIIISGMAILMPYTHLVSFAFFLLPLSCGMQGFVWIVVIGSLLLKGKKAPLVAIVFTLIIVLLELFNQSRHPAFDNNIKNTIFYFFSLLTIFYLTIEHNKHMDHAQNVRYFIYGTAFLFSMIFGRIILESGVAELLSGALRYSMDGKELANDYVFFTNANNIGLYSATCFAGLLMGRKRLNMPMVAYVIVLVVVVLGGALSFSRTWLLMTTASIVLYLVLSPKNKAFFAVIAILAIAVAFLLNSVLFEPIYEVFEMRLTSEDISDGAGRTDMFSLYHNFFVGHPEYWLTGTGSVYYLKICAQPNSIHNMLQQIYICYGIIGIGTFFLYFTLLLKRSRPYVSNLVQYLPFVIYIIFVQTLQFVNPIFCMYPLALVMACQYLKKQI